MNYDFASYGFFPKSFSVMKSRYQLYWIEVRVFTIAVPKNYRTWEITVEALSVGDRHELVVPP